MNDKQIEGGSLFIKRNGSTVIFTTTFNANYEATEFYDRFIAAAHEGRIEVKLTLVGTYVDTNCQKATWWRRLRARWAAYWCSHEELPSGDASYRCRKCGKE